MTILNVMRTRRSYEVLDVYDCCYRHLPRVELILSFWWKWTFNQRQLCLHCTLGFPFLGDLAMDMEIAIVDVRNECPIFMLILSLQSTSTDT